MQVSATEVMIVIMSMVVMIIVMVGRTREQPRTRAINHKPDYRHHQRLIEGDVEGIDESIDAFGHHDEREAEQEHCAGSTRWTVPGCAPGNRNSRGTLAIAAS